MGPGVTDAAQLLDLWERAGGLGPVERVLALAEAGGGDAQAMLDEPYGHTAGYVLELRERLMGPAMQATARCPRCSSRVEFAVDVEHLRRHQSEDVRPDMLAAYGIDCRPPTAGDLLAVADTADPAVELQRRCVAGARSIDIDDLPVDVVAVLDETLARADPLAELLVDLSCPECGAGFASDLDLGVFVWDEVDARARHLLQEIDVLARTYGWTESEVLALSEVRRAAYLRLANGEPG
jgi:hypothetical protein